MISKFQTCAIAAGISVFVAGCGGDKTQTDNYGNADRAAKKSITAQGSTFVQPFLTKVFDEYSKRSGFQINYTGGGSSAGIQGVSEGTVPFGASDAPMKDEEISGSKVGKILNLPLVLGVEAIIYNVPGAPNGLKLDGPTIAEIFMTKISKWNDPKIAALNPGVNLPDLAITVHARADGSGSTYVLSDYLSKVSPEWKSTMGTNKTLKWAERVQRWAQSAGVVNNAKQTPGSITYAELSWAKKSGLSYAAVKNLAGKFLLPEPKGATAAAAETKLSEDFRVSIVNAAGTDSYPISSYVFGLIPEDLTANPNGNDIVAAIAYTVTDGQEFAEALDYAKLPETVSQAVQEALKAVRTK